MNAREGLLAADARMAKAAKTHTHTFAPISGEHILWLQESLKSGVQAVEQYSSNV